jgi:hypothetical protein
LKLTVPHLNVVGFMKPQLLFFFINEILIFLEMRMRGRVTHDFVLLKVFFFFWVGVEYGTPLFCELLLAASIEELFTVRFWGYS